MTSPSRSTNTIEALRARLGADAVSIDENDIAARRHDYWALAHLRRRLGKLDAPPAGVVRPSTTAEVAGAVEIAAAHGVPIVPFGAGSGVCGGVLAPPDSLILDLSRMNRILSVEETGLTVTVQPGMRGDVFEAELNERGYSMGNFPQSIAVSSVGGWVATRASGQHSTKYGSTEDMLVGFEAVLASGEVIRLKPAPRRATGPDLCALFLGSEGTLGILTELTFRIHPRPEHRHPQSYAFGDMHSGLEAIRRVMRAGWRPAVLRLYDEAETARHFPEQRGACALLALSEGPRAAVETEVRAVDAIVREAGGRPTGAEPVETWLQHRNTVPSWDELMDQGVVADTVEVSVGWEAAAAAYDAITKAIREVPSVLLSSAHSSHSYDQGTCLYVTLVIHPKELSEAEATYEQCWDAAMRAVLSVGGSISHHHGIGRVRRRWLAEELGSAYGVLKTIKRAFDPKGILNPGVLLPE